MTVRSDGRFTRIPPSKVTMIRADKLEGYSLDDIVKRHSVAKSTASLYCRDLFYNPNRKYVTEEDNRMAIYEKAKSREHNIYKKCVDCGTKIRNKSTRCQPCMIIWMRDNRDKYAEYGRRSTFHQGSKRRFTAKPIIEKPKKQRIYPPIYSEPCPSVLSPTGVHYWILNSDNQGTCKYCNEVKSFKPTY